MADTINSAFSKARAGLVSAAIAKILPPLYANESKKPAEIQVAFKIFNPYGAGTWFITEGNLETGELFGLCDLGMGCPELGYVDLTELAQIRVRGMPLERDLYWTGTLAKAMQEVGYEYGEAA